MSNYYLLLLNCKICFQEFELQLSHIHSSWIICSTGYSGSSVSTTLMRHLITLSLMYFISLQKSVNRDNNGMTSLRDSHLHVIAPKEVLL